MAVASAFARDEHGHFDAVGPRGGRLEQPTEAVVIARATAKATSPAK